jgi:hypothetical protein
VPFKAIKKESPRFGTTTIHIQNEKAELASDPNFKRPFPPTTPFGKRMFIRLVGLRIHQIYLMSIQKRDIENYLFL